MFRPSFRAFPFLLAALFCGAALVNSRILYAQRTPSELAQRDRNFPLVTAPITGFVPGPRVVRAGQVEYTAEALRAKLQGVVMLRVTMDDKGTPTRVAVERGLGLGLDQKAIEAARKTRFIPVLRNGTPVESEILFPVLFLLPKQPTPPTHPLAWRGAPRQAPPK